MLTSKSMEMGSFYGRAGGCMMEVGETERNMVLVGIVQMIKLRSEMASGATEKEVSGLIINFGSKLERLKLGAVSMIVGEKVFRCQLGIVVDCLKEMSCININGAS
jgi:hypothetical protein